MIGHTDLDLLGMLLYIMITCVVLELTLVLKLTLVMFLSCCNVAWNLVLVVVVFC